MQEFECTYCVHEQAKMYKSMKTREEKWRYEKCSSGGTLLLEQFRHLEKTPNMHSACFTRKYDEQCVFLFTANGF